MIISLYHLLFSLFVFVCGIHFFHEFAAEALWGKKKGRPVLKGPLHLPIFGHALHVIWYMYHGKNLEHVHSLMLKYGEIFKINLCMQRCVAVTSPRLVEHILKTNFKNYVKGSQFNQIMSEFLGTGIFNSDGEIWKLHRKKASHLFSIRHLRDYMCPVFERHSCYFMKKLESSACTTNYIDINVMYQQFTLDSIGEVAFGEHLNSIENPNTPFSKAFDQASNVTAFRAGFPHWKVLKPFLQMEKEYKKSLKVMENFAMETIERKRKSFNETNQEQRDQKGGQYDLLAQFITMKDDQGEPYSDRFLRDLVMNVLIAGRDTTAVTLAWTTYMLCKHPQIQKKVQEEIDTVLDGANPTYETVNKMEYLHRVLNETLRLYPPVPVDFKCAVEDDILPTGHFIHKGTRIFYNIYALNRREDLWSNPLEFLPDRWISKAPTPFEFPTFNAGPRMCLGKQMAQVEVKMLISKLLQKYTLELKPDHVVAYDMSLTMALKNGLFVRCKPRSTTT